LSEANDYEIVVCAIQRSIMWWDTQECYPYEYSR